MFRFDTEADPNNRLVEVVYWCVYFFFLLLFLSHLSDLVGSTSYELQIALAFRKPPQGFGTLLMHTLERFAALYDMQKVMLTVFTGSLIYPFR